MAPSLRLSLFSLPLTLLLTACNHSQQESLPQPTVPTVFEPIVFQIYMNSAQQVPAVSSSAMASASLSLDPNTGELSGTLTLDEIQADAAHIHQGFAGENGAVIAAFSPEQGEDRLQLETVVLDEAQQTRLMDGGFYVNVHTPAFPGGELRGQILADGVSLRLASLHGGQVTTSLVTPASGQGYLTIDTKDNEVNAVLHLHNLADPVEVSLHTGQIGQSNEPIAVLVKDTEQDNLMTLSMEDVPQETLDALNNGQAYLLAKTELYPEGEIRGQLLAPEVRLFNFHLDALQLEHPGTPAQTASAYLLLDQLTDDMNIRVTLPESMANLGAALYQGSIHGAGSLMMPLNADATQPGSFSLSASLSETDAMALLQEDGFVQLEQAGQPMMRGKIAATPSQTGLWLDASSLVSDRQQFSIFWDGQPLGQATIVREVSEQQLTITEITDAVPFGVVETLSVVLDKATAAPLHYSGTGTSGERQIAIELNWAANLLSGQTDLQEQPVDQRLPGNSLEQLGLFYSMHAFPLSEGLVYPMTVYNGLDGSLLERTLQVTGSEQVTVAAGTFDTFRVELNGAEVNQIFYISKEVPRKLVKIGFDAFPITYELQ